jgi:hypothetical protein
LSTKIQINSLEALERLIGGDNEVEVELRGSVVQEFAKKHLKCIAQEYLGKIEGDITETIKEVAEERIGKYKTVGWTRRFYLNQDIQEAVNAQLDIALSDVVRKKLDEYDLDARAQRVVNQVVGDELSKRIRDAVKEKFSEALKKLSD